MKNNWSEFVVLAIEIKPLSGKTFKRRVLQTNISALESNNSDVPLNGTSTVETLTIASCLGSIAILFQTKKKE